MRGHDDRDYEHQNAGPDPERVHLTNVELQVSSFDNLCDLLREHTLFLRFFYVLLLAATASQFLDVWQGDVWVLPSVDLWHEHMDWLVEIHMSLTEHNETLHHVAKSYQRDTSFRGDELYHPDAVSRIVHGHWQTPLILAAMYLNFLLLASLVARKFFLYFRKGYRGLVFTYSLCVLSLIGQALAIVLRVYVFIFFTTFCGGAALVFNVLCVLPEVLSMIDLYRLRSTVIWLSLHYEQLNENLKDEMPGEEGEAHVADIMQESRPWKSPILEAIFTGIQNLDGLYNAPPKRYKVD